MIEKIDRQLGKGMEILEVLQKKKVNDWEKIPEELEYTSDIIYAYAGGKPLLLDMYKPKEKTEEKHPALVFIHGGGWKSGDKRSIPALFVAINGYVKISINYRLVGEESFPAQLQDCKTAVRWLRAHADEYNIDPDRIGVWGSSAGGHLASLMGVTEGIEEFEGDCFKEYSSKVNAVLSCSGPSDLVELCIWKESMMQFLNNKITNALEKAKEKFGLMAPIVGEFFNRLGKGILGGGSEKSLEMFIGSPLEGNEEKWRYASPVFHVKPGLPPFLLMHGISDPLVPVSQAYVFYEALRSAGGEVIFTPLSGHGHNVLWDNQGNFKRENAAYIIDFFDRYLKK
jgi:acetyl esterase/lipase